MRRTTLLLGMLLVVVCACSEDAGSKQARVFARSAIKVLPADTTMVMGVNLTKLRGTDLWKKAKDGFMDKQRDRGGFFADGDEMKKLCGMDPLEAVQTAVLGAGAGGDMDEAVLIASGDWDEDKVVKCYIAVGEAHGGKPTHVKDGAVTQLTDAAHPERDVAIGWIDSRTVVLAMGDKSNPEKVKTLLAGKSSAAEDGDLKAMLDKVDMGGTIWIAAKLDEDMTSGLRRQLGGVPTSGWASVRVGKGIKVSGGARFGDSKSAKDAADKIKSFLPMIKAEPKLKGLRVELRADGKDVVGSVDAPEGVLKAMMSEGDDE